MCRNTTSWKKKEEEEEKIKRETLKIEKNNNKNIKFFPKQNSKIFHVYDEW